MDIVNYIVKNQLPSHQDFTTLKAKALAYIQTHIGSEWTNFNPSDPGITILDQFCYALTELGYCTDFSIQDILTNANGQIDFKDQFYQPSEIFTTAPCNINDYKKYLIDEIENIVNVEIVCYGSNLPLFSRVYQVYLYINPDITDVDERSAICREVYYYLNKSRNLGELFNMPVALQPVICQISGKIELQQHTEPYDVLLKLQDKIRSFIFSNVNQQGYNTLNALGYNAAEIFDGPNLANGWILNESLTNKKNSVQAVDLVPVIDSVKDVISISGLQLYQNGKTTQTLESDINQIIAVDVLGSYQSKKLVLTCSGKELAFDAFGPLKLNDDNFEETTAVLNKEDKSKLPKSNFRDINTYYSIQNTFPAQYGIGTDTIEDSNPVQVAQSRQLKGYLTLFDQILANQFSQLANVSKLFSFKNSLSGAPSDEASFYALKDKYEQEHLQYPVPYQMFAPSYFYQSLYSVPHIKPLLKDNKTFDFGYANDSSVESKEKSWLEYQQDPYNPYIFGLMKIMEQENINLDRRNHLLDHLLARHGESPKVIDAFIDDTVYTGEKRKDQIIVKSLYLQNLGSLSYNRQKAYNFISASKIHTDASGILDVSLPKIKEKHFQFINENTTDFIFKSEQINKKEKLHAADYTNFSGIELKMSLLFGLKNIYSNFINAKLEVLRNSTLNPLNRNEYLSVQESLWFTEKRNGTVVIETVLLLKQLQFDLEIIKPNQVNYSFYNIQNIDFEAVSNLNYLLNTSSQSVLDSEFEQGYLSFADSRFPFSFGSMPLENLRDYTQTSQSDYLFRIKIVSGDGNITLDSRVFRKNMLFLFPDFIPALQTAEFKKRLKQFLKASLPVNISTECLFVNSTQLEEFIPKYMYWHESLRHKSLLLPIYAKEETAALTTAAKTAMANPSETALNLINSITSILESRNGRN
ncbi:hypothetical protein ASE21_11855 [Flavobacterium sp. Root901]|uniref:hypothetical protein n=1 Tax=Flavobacterium sp. Root901 TaxID=1736605 RepID=UPI000709E6D7|nr:hypothetical protein [Flavobacterium sp. Root901]KRD10393.1 hypothetical protein ASE21_11855 [Flavobacterium sp. Root901]